MSISTLASQFGFQSFPHFTAGRSGAKIDKIVIHHMATTNFDSVPSIWQTRQVSAHYGIGKNGEIHAYVDENNTAWHAGNWEANISSIGIEHCNSTGEPAWGINQATIDASAKLCADIAKRYGLGKLVPNKNLFPHSHFSATACPGQLLNKLQYIADKANAINTGGGSSTPSTQTSGLYRVRKIWADAKNQKGAFKDLANAKKCADGNKGYSVFDDKGKAVYTSGATSTLIPQPTTNYKVQVAIKDLNIRTGPGTNYNKTGKFTGIGVFSIIAESTGVGASKWGKLKSGAGWISLDYVKKV
jgi:hypothetical protein